MFSLINFFNYSLIATCNYFHKSVTLNYLATVYFMGDGFC